MAQLRKDPIIGEWVIVATTESLHLEDYDRDDHTFQQIQFCQFCPGREHLTPPEVAAVRLNGSPPNAPGWTVRVVPNKFPVLRIEEVYQPPQRNIYQSLNGVGAHEVLIETPHHTKDLADLPLEEIQQVLKTYSYRGIKLAEDRRFKYIIVFKNYGESAGATLEHAHSQLIALPLVPKFVQAELDGAHHYYLKENRCVFCDILQREIRDEERMVAENNHFVCFCPFVQRYPFECWIVPKTHQADYRFLPEGEQRSWASLIKDVLSRIKKGLGDPSYNFYLHGVPVNTKVPEGYHWHMEIIPRLTYRACLAWGMGMNVVWTEPSLAAQCFKEAL